MDIYAVFFVDESDKEIVPNFQFWCNRDDAIKYKRKKNYKVFKVALTEVKSFKVTEE